MPIDQLAPATRQLIDVPLGVGESLVWDAQRQCLWFIDILAPALFCLDPETSRLERWDMPATIGSFGLCPDGRLVLALRTGIHLFDPASRRFDFLVHPEPERTRNRLNDGKIGPDGRFWVGSMDDTPDKQAGGALHRVDPDGTSTLMVDGLTVSNGLAWSPDGATMFHSDSRQCHVWAYDFDAATGDIANRRLLRTMTSEEGRPDGGAADAAGFYWSAGVSAGRLNRLSGTGEIVAQLTLPVPAPTMPCFGGDGLRTLFVTSLGPGGDPAGTLLRVAAGITGAPVARFGEPLVIG